MIRGLIFTLLVGLSGYTSAHQLTPTYPELRMSYIDGVYQTTMQLFNRREEVEYYEISVYDSEWNKIPFASKSRIYHVTNLQTITFDVFIREADKDKAVYICSRSRILKNEQAATVISSRVCSKIK